MACRDRTAEFNSVVRSLQSYHVSQLDTPCRVLTLCACEGGADTEEQTNGKDIAGPPGSEVQSTAGNTLYCALLRVFVIQEDWLRH